MHISQFVAYKKWVAKLILFTLFYSWLPLVSVSPVNAAPPLTVTIDKSSTQASPTSNKNVKYTVVFSDPINTTTFGTGDIDTSSSTATGITVNSITQTGALDGTTFEVNISSFGTGNIIATIPAGQLSYSGGIFGGTTGNSPTAITVDTSGNVFTANGTSTVTRISSTGSTSQFGGTIGSDPRGIVRDALGNVYTADYLGYGISKISSTGVTNQSWAFLGGTPVDIAIDNLGYMYTVNYSNSIVNKISSTGSVLQIGTIVGSQPRGIAVDLSGNIFVTLSSNNSVTKITSTGATTQSWATTGASPYGITTDSSGNVYTANLGANTVTKITPDGTATQLGTTTGTQPRDIAIDSFGNVYTSNQVSNSITKISSTGATTQSWATTGTTPYAIAVDSSGSVYTVNRGSNNVTRILKTETGIQDASGNLNMASMSTVNTVSIIADTTSPDVTINKSLGQASPTNDKNVKYTVVFSEAIDATSFGTGDIDTSTSTATGITVNSITHTGALDNTTFELSVSSFGDGDITATIPASTGSGSGMKDLAGNWNTGSTSTGTGNTIKVDVTSPDVTINKSLGQGSPTNDKNVKYTVVFSEAIDATSFGTGDIDTSTSTATGITVNSITHTGALDNTTFELAVSSFGDGNITATIPASTGSGSGIKDLAGNWNTGSTSTGTGNTISVITAVVVVAGGGGGVTYVPYTAESSSTNVSNTENSQETDANMQETTAENTQEGDIGTSQEESDTGTSEEDNNTSEEIIPETEEIMFQNYIEQLISQQAVNTTLETYMPETGITRAEFLKILLNVKKIDYLNADISENTFSDLDMDSWTSKVTLTAFKQGIADGYDDGTFRPNIVISRIEALKLIVKIAGIELEETDATDFVDVEIDWMKKYVNYGYEQTIISGQTSDFGLIFRPQEIITRGESAKFIIRGTELLNQENGE